MSLSSAGAVSGLAAWAHGLDNHRRNGGDDWYSLAFLCVGALVAVTLFAWTSLAGRVLREVLPASRPSQLGVVRSASRGLVVAMVAVAVGSCAWALSIGPLLAPVPGMIAIFMALGLVLAAAGATRDGLVPSRSK